MSHKVWVLGDAVVDLIPDGKQHYLRCPGGAPANVAVAIARLGGSSAFIGKVGNDPLGRFMRDTLQQERVNTDYMSLAEQQRTSTVIVDLDANGERSFTFMVNPSADQFLEKSNLPHFSENQWLHCCSIALLNQPSRDTTISAMQQIKQAGGFVSFDPNLRASLWASQAEMIEVVWQGILLADVIKFSAEELTLLCQNRDFEQALNQFCQQYHEKLVVVTLGAEGALFCLAGQREQIQGKSVKAVDTTGAGDAFVGGLLYGLAQSTEWRNIAQLPTIIRQANACGALAVTAKGAMSALPDQAALKHFLSSH